MTKRHAKALEQLFAAEVEASLKSIPYLALVQSKSRVFGELEELGLCQPATFKAGNPPWVVTMVGRVLTEPGRMAYCQWASEQPESDDAEG